jgi:hypothetical protein
MRTALLAFGLALAAPFAHADTWTLTYADMPDHWAGPATISVVFSGQDIDGNGLIEQAEITDLAMLSFGRTYAVWPIQHGDSGHGPIESSLDVFSFSTQQHTFAASFQGINGEDFLAFDSSTGFYQDAAFWSIAGVTPSVQVVSAEPPAAAVPEPSTWALLLAGITCLGSSARARGRNTRGPSGSR